MKKFQIVIVWIEGDRFAEVETKEVEAQDINALGFLYEVGSIWTQLDGGRYVVAAHKEIP